LQNVLCGYDLGGRAPRPEGKGGKGKKKGKGRGGKKPRSRLCGVAGRKTEARIKKREKKKREKEKAVYSLAVSA